MRWRGEGRRPRAAADVQPSRIPGSAGALPGGDAGTGGRDLVFSMLLSFPSRSDGSTVLNMRRREESGQLTAGRPSLAGPFHRAVVVREEAEPGG